MLKFQLSNFNCWIDSSTQRLHITWKIPANHLLMRFGEWQCKTATKTMEIPATGLPQAQTQEVLMKKTSSSSLSPVSVSFFRSWPWSQSNGIQLRAQLCNHRMGKTLAKQVTEFVQALHHKSCVVVKAQLATKHPPAAHSPTTPNWWNGERNQK